MRLPDVHPQLLVEGVHVLPDRFPAHSDGVEHLHGNGFNVGQKLGQPGRLARAHRCQRQRAIADDDGGGAVIAGEGAQRVPGHLRIIVAVIIDEARRDHQAVGINRTRRSIPEFADRDNFALADANIATEGRHAGAINDATVLNQEIIRHGLILLAGGAAEAQYHYRASAFSCLPTYPERD